MDFNIMAKTITLDMINRMSILEFYGIHFINENSDSSEEKRFTIPELTELTNSDTKEGELIKYDLSTQEGLTKFAIEESWNIASEGIRLMIKNSSELSNLIHDSEINLLLSTIKEKTKYVCSVVPGMHWTKEDGIRAMDEYVKTMYEKLS